MDGDEADRRQQADRARDDRRVAVAERDEPQRDEDRHRTEQTRQALDQAELAAGGLAQGVIRDMDEEQKRESEVREQEPTHTDYYAPGTPADASSRSISSSLSSSSAAATFSSRCSIELVPGIGSITGERCSSQASAT